jgi:8-oxo-dGTP diphosphatase
MAPQRPQPRSPRDETEGLDQFLVEYNASSFDRPSVAVDVVLVTVIDELLRVLLIQRQEHPSKGRWSLPGGFVGVKESLDEAAGRVLRQKAGLKDLFLEQLYTFGDVRRDPRTRVISVAYYALVPAERLAGSLDHHDDRTLARLQVPWSGEEGGAVTLIDQAGRSLPIAFDHESIVGMTVKRLRGKVDYAPIGYELLPPTFTLRQLQVVHQAILARPLNKDAFRRRMLATGALRPTGRYESEVDHRPAELYRVNAPSARTPGQGGRHG